MHDGIKVTTTWYGLTAWLWPMYLYCEASNISSDVVTYPLQRFKSPTKITLAKQLNSVNLGDI